MCTGLRVPGGGGKKSKEDQRSLKQGRKEYLRSRKDEHVL